MCVGEKLFIFPAHRNTPHLLLPWKFGATKCSSRLWVTVIPEGLDDIGGHWGTRLWPLFPWQRDTALGNISDLWLGGGPGEGGRIVRDEVYEVRGVWKRKGNMEAQNKHLHIQYKCLYFLWISLVRQTSDIQVGAPWCLPTRAGSDAGVQPHIWELSNWKYTVMRRENLHTWFSRLQMNQI